MPELSKDEQKELIKLALQEWLDKQFATFGKWSLAGIASMALAVMTYLWLTQHGWAK